MVLDIYAEPPVADTDEELEEYEEEFGHTYATVDCGGECGGCVALIVDGVVVSGPPFHPHCGCSLSPQDIKNAEQHKSNLHGMVAPDRNVDTRDVEWLKKSLTQLDCYEPDTRAGESADNPNPYPNQKLFDAIEKFRKLQKIKERGAVKPGHWTEVKINQELEKKERNKSIENATFEKPVNVKPGQYAVFDGKKVTLYEDDKPIMSWDAVSGKDGYRRPEYQNLKDTGPIPEGTYVARQSELQFYKDITWDNRLRSAVGFGTWRGGTDSWGESRVWLEPSKETNTYDRSGFSVHGGAEPGSAGCIDLTHHIDEFTQWFEKNGHDLIINVKYH
ncbi:MAG: DUF2778 domain-containing protein [Alphaproteobacteria bacterium]|nr:DUF2778 domain-containing protein [Alphaproteobacteria bacterium]